MYTYILTYFLADKEWLKKIPEALGFTFMSLMHTHTHIDPNKQLHKCIYTHIHIDILMYIHTCMYAGKEWLEKMPAAPGFEDMARCLRDTDSGICMQVWFVCLI